MNEMNMMRVIQKTMPNPFIEVMTFTSNIPDMVKRPAKIVYVNHIFFPIYSGNSFEIKVAVPRQNRTNDIYQLNNFQ